MHLKETSCTGRKRVVWVTELYADVREDLERLRSTVMNTRTLVLRMHVRELIQSAESPSVYHHNIAGGGRSILDRIIRWVLHFMTSNSIMLRSHPGKLTMSPGEQALIDKSVAFPLGIF